MSSDALASAKSAAPSSRRSGGDFVGKTLSGVTEALQHAVFDQDAAAGPGLLQKADPRAKVIAALSLLLTAGLVRHLLPVLVLCTVCAGLAAASELPLLRFVRRAWLGIPLFAAIVAAPSIFMVSGAPVLVVLNAAPLWLAVTDNGLAGAALFIARVGASVSVAVLLVSTTRWADLLSALRVLRLPESLVVVLGMTYRYLFLFLHSANGLFLARSSRTVGRTSGSEQRRWAAGAAGFLIGKSVKMSGDVMLAMRARGFSGEVRTATTPVMRDGDWLLLALAVLLSAAILLLDVRAL